MNNLTPYRPMFGDEYEHRNKKIGKREASGAFAQALIALTDKFKELRIHRGSGFYGGVECVTPESYEILSPLIAEAKRLSAPICKEMGHDDVRIIVAAKCFHEKKTGGIVTRINIILPDGKIKEVEL